MEIKSADQKRTEATHYYLTGYGETQGVPHKSKSIAELGQADQKNEWFEKGMEAVSLAPTADQSAEVLF